MTRSRTLIDLRPDQQDLLRALSRGATPEDVGWAVQQPADEVLARAQEALDALAGETQPPASAAERRKVGAYLLRRQSPGVAAGTWDLLQRSDAAAAYGSALRKALTGLADTPPPELPEGDGARFSYQRGEADANGHDAGLTQLADRRQARKRLRTQQEVKQVAAIAVSPYREEAVEAYRKDDEDIKLPHYASRPARLSAYACLVLLLVGLVMAAVVKVPVYTSAKVLVVNLPESAPSDQQGLSVVGIFPSDVRGKVKVGQKLRVQLPDTEDRVSTRIAYVSDGVLAPEEVRDRFGLDGPTARRVRGPSVVVVAELRTPDGAPDRSTFEGAITEQADVRTDRERIASLVF